MSRRTRRAIIAGGLVALAVVVAGQRLTGLYADYHWFASLGFESRFWKLELIHLVAWVLVVPATAAVLFLTLWSVARRAGPIRVRRQLGDLQISEALPRNRVRNWLLIGSFAIALLVAAPIADSLGESVAFALAAVPWGAGDAVLNRDPRTYVFILPALRGVWSLLLTVTVWAGICVSAFLILTGQLQAERGKVSVEAFARRILVYIGAVFLVLIAAHFALAALEAVGGRTVDYALVRAGIPARRLMAILSLFAAAALLVSEFRRNWNLALSGLVVLAVVLPLSMLVYPEIIQRLRVEPNELEVERPYIIANVTATRHAYGLDRVDVQSYAVDMTPPEPEKLRSWTSGLPLWDERPLRATLNQLQGLEAFHEFPDVEYDRYGAPGEEEQVAVAVREFAPSRLDASARTWQNLHLRYTHGRGLVVSPVDRVASGGEPEYFISGLPPVVAPDAPLGMSVTQPRVYFGELTSEYVIVTTDSLPEGVEPTGVWLSSLGRRFAFAWALRSKNILLRRPAGERGLLMWRRQIVPRVQAIVPFLSVDPDPYPILDDGQVKWIVELYAATALYPLSEPLAFGRRRLNYIRNVGKAVVDGVTGDVTLFALEPEDPLLATFTGLFPDLFVPVEEMPPSIRRHLRYPQTLLRAQAAMLEAYHLIEPDEFYRKQGLWSVAKEVYRDRPVDVQPYYLLMPMPGTESSPPEFLLTIPFTPASRDNLAAFLVARNDGDVYGQLSLFEVASSGQVFGPRQIEVQIDQDPNISQELSLWRQLGSSATRGHLLLVPIEGFMLYVEPLFLEAEDREGAAPGLKRVIAASGDQVSMSETLDGALNGLFSGRAISAAPSAEATDQPSAGEQPTELTRLKALLREADRAMRDGDMVRFGEIWEELRTAGVIGQ